MLDPLGRPDRRPGGGGCAGWWSVRPAWGWLWAGLVCEVAYGRASPVSSPSFLSDPGARVIVVKHGDRLTRFGFERVAASLASARTRIVVLDAGETGNDLAGDVSGVLASWCARRSGRGSGWRRAAQAVAVAAGGQPV